MNRKEFLCYLSTLSVGGYLVSCGVPSAPATARKIPGSILGADHKHGHLLRNAFSRKPDETIKRKVLIVGGGVSGLSALHRLTKSGVYDVTLLELHEKEGGNALSGKNEVSAYPWGAHYLPIANIENKELIEFLEEHSIITSWQNDLPVYNEDYLCFEPEERLFIRNRWQDGLIPQVGISDSDRSEIHRFLELMSAYRRLKGTDGKSAFTIPIVSCSNDPEILKLNSILFSDFLKELELTCAPLLWYLDYCMRDDYGTSLTEVSAWAGIHYFASRKGEAVNAAYEDVLTWPQGNGKLVEALGKKNKDRICPSQLVFSVNNGSVLSLDILNDKVIEYKAEQIIMATPQFINQHIIKSPDYPDLSLVCKYAPWMVANITVKEFPSLNGVGMSWDNVIYNARSLGYVSANHQDPKLFHDRRVLTFYLPLSDLDPAEARKLALSLSHEDWVDVILKDLTIPHPDIAEKIENIDVWIWGHAMIKPLPNVIGNRGLMALRDTHGKNIHFANSDISGISIFEEAFSNGYSAAEKVINQLT